MNWIHRSIQIAVITTGVILIAQYLTEENYNRVILYNLNNNIELKTVMVVFPSGKTLSLNKIDSNKFDNKISPEDMGTGELSLLLNGVNYSVMSYVKPSINRTNLTFHVHENKIAFGTLGISE
jgi:hypothetical protein